MPARLVPPNTIRGGRSDRPPLGLPTERRCRASSRLDLVRNCLAGPAAIVGVEDAGEADAAERRRIIAVFVLGATAGALRAAAGAVAITGVDRHFADVGLGALRAALAPCADGEGLRLTAATAGLLAALRRPVVGSHGRSPRDRGRGRGGQA